MISFIGLNRFNFPRWGRSSLVTALVFTSDGWVINIKVAVILGRLFLVHASNLIAFFPSFGNFLIALCNSCKTLHKAIKEHFNFLGAPRVFFLLPLGVAVVFVINMVLIV